VVAADGSQAACDELEKAQPDELESAAAIEAPGTPAKPCAEEALSSPKSDGEADEGFTFGTTTPLKLPDPALLRQMASAQDARGGHMPGSSGAIPAPERRTPRWEPADYQHAPLASVQEVSTPQPVSPQRPTPQPLTPPPLQPAPLSEQAGNVQEYALALQGSPQPQYAHQHHALQLQQQAQEEAQVAQQWQLQQASQMTPQYAHHALQLQQAQEAQVAQQWQLQQAQEAQLRASWHEEVQKQQSWHEEARRLQSEQQLQITKSSEAEAYGPYFGQNGEQSEEDLKVQPQERSKSRLVAAGCIVFLAVLGVGIVVALAA